MSLSPLIDRWWKLPKLAVALGAWLAASGLATAQQAAPSGQAPPKAAPQQGSPPKDKPVAKKKAPAKDPTAAIAEVESGVAALEQGRPEVAVGHLDSAINSGTLPAEQSARALYYRGVGFRRSGKPAQAISDLTNALWIKSGLTEAQRADALSQRSGAYREAGLPDQSAPVPSAGPAKAKAGSPATPLAAVAPAAPAAKSSGGFFGNLFGGGASATPTPAPSPAPIPVATTAVSQPSSTAATPATGSGGPRPATRIVPLTPDVSNLPVGFQDVPGGVREVEVKTAPPRPVTPPGVVGKAWDQPVEIKSAAAKTAAAKATAAPSAGGVVGAKTSMVSVQVALARTEQEARGVASRVQSQYGRELGGRSPVVEQAPPGPAGAVFYRVNVGPFASSREATPFCEKLKVDGMACRIVAQ